MYQFNIVFGILVAYFSNYLIGEYVQVNAWRWMLGVEAIPAAVYALFVLWVPESPRWLVVKLNDDEGAARILQKLNPGQNINQLLQQIKSSVHKSSKSIFFSKKYSFVMLLAFLVAFFNQFSGINFVLYYAPRIFEQAGFAQSEVLGASVPIGITLVIFTLLGMYLIDKIGRRQLLLYGSIGYIISLTAVAWAFFSGLQGGWFVVFIVAFIAAHGVGQGTVIWVFISEIFPNQVRDYGMSLGAGTHWICAAVITLVTPAVLNKNSGGTIFAFFAGMMLLQLFFVIFMMPETKNKSLEELEEQLFPQGDAL
jgi:sugar porter (SP) family MFS transporter